MHGSDLSYHFRTAMLTSFSSVSSGSGILFGVEQPHFSIEFWQKCHFFKEIFVFGAMPPATRSGPRTFSDRKKILLALNKNTKAN
jgi:hypothetical protein